MNTCKENMVINRQRRSLNTRDHLLMNAKGITNLEDARFSLSRVGRGQIIHKLRILKLQKSCPLKEAQTAGNVVY